MSTNDKDRDDAADPRDDELEPRKARAHFRGIPPADDPRYDEHTIVLGGGARRPRPTPPALEAGFSPEGFLQRLQWLVQEGPCAPDPPDRSCEAGPADALDAPGSGPLRDPDAPGRRNPYEVPEEELTGDDLVAMSTNEGALLGEYIANLKAAGKAKREGDGSAVTEPGTGPEALDLDVDEPEVEP